MTAKELAKMVQLCGRAEDQGVIDDDDVKQLIKAMDDAALPTLVREENWRKAHERRKKRNNKPETPEDPERYIPFYEKEARLDNAVRMLQDKLTANTPIGRAALCGRRSSRREFAAAFLVHAVAWGSVGVPGLPLSRGRQ